ncbi:MAG TPA: glycosyl hydrolase [Pontiella sp.]
MHKKRIHALKQALGIILTLLTAQAGASDFYSIKKGVGHYDAAGINALNVSWYYNWNMFPNRDVNPSIEFVPMRHNMWWPPMTDLLHSGECKYFLPYNEPDHIRDDKPTVQQALDFWPQIEAACATNGGLKIGSAACTDSDNWWQNDFMSNALSQGLQIDFMTFHGYPTPPSTHSLLIDAKWYWDKYGMDVWITEFNAADWDGFNEYTHAQSYTFIAESLYRFESTDYITRYAIFPWDASWPEESKASYVFAETNSAILTPLGKLYANYRSSDIHGPHTNINYYLHNKGTHKRLRNGKGSPGITDVYTEGAEVEFILAECAGGAYAIINPDSGKRLALKNEKLSWQKTANKSAEWKLVNAEYGWHHIENVKTGAQLKAVDNSLSVAFSQGKEYAFKWAFIRANPPADENPKKGLWHKLLNLI